MIHLLTTPAAFFGAFALFGAGALCSLLAARRDPLANWLGNGFAALGSLLALLVSGAALAGFPTSLGIRSVPTYTVPSPWPPFSLTFHLDALSAFFMLVISLIALATSIYALGYVKHWYGAYPIGTLGFYYNLFLASTLAVVGAHSILLFLAVWEMMSLSSYFLVVFEHREEENVRAGFLYFIMTHIGTAFIFLSLFLLYRATGSLDFEAVKANIGAASLATKNLVFLSALVGFGIKSGIIPLHIWLPSAHPAAPSHVSAFMSGVMIKTGIYMFARIFLDILPQPPLWWGVLVLVIGASSALLGVLYALAEHDIKRLLAYHSIENIGIILLGLGSSLIFVSLDMPALALLGLAAALFHTLNHAIFKALLFLASGSVVAAMRTRNMEEYGGLIKYMPVTAATFLMGSMAISGLPPFNGFFSEWVTFQAMFGGLSAAFGVKLLFILAIGALAFTSGLAAACFVKAFGATFLARPRSAEAAHAREASPLMQISMWALALLTLGIGLGAGVVFELMLRVAGSAASLAGAPIPGSVTAAAVHLNGFARLSMPVLGALIAAGVLATGVFTAVVSRRHKSVTGITWDCGTSLTPRMEITATGFSRSILMVVPVRDVYTPYLYQPLAAAMAKASRTLRRLQGGNINVYILYIFLTLLGLLFLLSMRLI